MTWKRVGYLSRFIREIFLIFDQKYRFLCEFHAYDITNVSISFVTRGRIQESRLEKIVSTLLVNA